MSELRAIETPRLTLRGANAGDLAALRRLWNEPRVKRFLFDDSPVDESAARDILGSCLEQATRGLGLWLLFERIAEQRSAERWRSRDAA